MGDAAEDEGKMLKISRRKCGCSRWRSKCTQVDVIQGETTVAQVSCKRTSATCWCDKLMHSELGIQTSLPGIMDQ